MLRNTYESISLWMAPGEIRVGETLKHNGRTDVCVVGAGVSGLTTAYLLAQEGRKVIVLDQGTIGSGDSCRTTAHLSNAIDARYSQIERLHGENTVLDEGVPQRPLRPIARHPWVVAQSGRAADGRNARESTHGTLSIAPGARNRPL